MKVKDWGARFALDSLVSFEVERVDNNGYRGRIVILSPGGTQASTVFDTQAEAEGWVVAVAKNFWGVTL